MHVVYIHQHFSTTRGATGTRSYEMAQRLIQAGHSVTMICGSYAAGDLDACGSDRVTDLDVDGIRVLRINEPYGNRMGFARRLIAFGRFARSATKLVSRLDGDLVFATSTPLTVGIPGMKGAAKLGACFVFEVRDLWPDLAIAVGVLKNPLLIAYARRLERRIYHSAHHIIALAPGIRDGICRTGTPPQRVSTIPNCSDLSMFVPSPERLDDSRFGDADEFRLVFTGAHGLANGLDAVLDGALELKRRGVSGVRFVFIGAGNQKEILIARSRQEGLNDMISWVDPMPKEELAQILPRMDVGLMILKNVPEFYYGTSPNKFFDYIASGLPVLNNYPGWLADLINEHDIGVCVQPDDPEAFADGVLTLRKRKKEFTEIAARARQLAEEQFSRDELGQRFVETLESAYASFTGR